MKRINLKGLREVLSEKELKNVMGGSGIATDLCDEKYGRKICKKQNECSGSQLCISSGGSNKCCF